MNPPTHTDQLTIDVHAHIFKEMHGLVKDGATRGIGHGRITIGDNEMQLMPACYEKTEYTSRMLVTHMDEAGVDKAVLLQGSFYGECNEYVLEAARKFPARLAAAAYFDPWQKDCRKIFDATVPNKNFRALKLECSELGGFCGIYPHADLATTDIAWLWEEIEKLGLVLTLDLGRVGSRSYQTGAVRKIAEGHPDLRIVIAHLGQPTPEVERNAALQKLWEEQIDLGRLPNVWFDTAALPAYLPTEKFPYPSAGRYIRAAIDRIGPTRVMCGTDLPGLLAHADYAQLVEMVRIHTGYLSPADRNLVMGGNAMNVYF